jgi:hypothetical protein
MKAKFEHIAVTVENPYLVSEWFKKYFDFDYYEGDILEKDKKAINTRTTLKNPSGDMLELFSGIVNKSLGKDAISHIAFIVDCIDEYYNRFKEDNLIDETTKIVSMKDFKLMFITTVDGITLELLERS